MSTRSMTLVQQTYSDPDKHVPLYRHCGGYVAGAGATLLEMFDMFAARGEQPQHAEAVLGHLLSIRYRKSDDETLPEYTFGSNGDPMYRAATWQPEEQGDLEYVYVLTRSADRDSTAQGPEWLVTIHERPSYRTDPDADDWRLWPKRTLTVPQLRTEVEKEQRETEKRIAAMQQRRA